mmetsp:Transcript_63027/g.130679  ORF Transcript_63027/g.130679 Transcript_63027/m.130679 type:complete len:241 (-) Transcript_63027:82-804(-)
MQQRLLDILTEVQSHGPGSAQGVAGDAREDLTTRKPRDLPAGEAVDERTERSSLGRALRLGREHAKAQEYQRLVEKLCAPPAKPAGPRRPRGGASSRKNNVKNAPAAPRRPATGFDGDGNEAARSPSPPLVVHRHYHHHYHHHYVLEDGSRPGTEERSHAREDTGWTSKAPASEAGANDEDAKSAEMQHFHRHTHIAEEITARARKLHDAACEAQHGHSHQQGARHPDSESPDPRLPRLC